MGKKITRRYLLKTMAALLGTAALAPLRPIMARQLSHFPESANLNRDTWALKGRAIHTVAFYKEPTTQSERLDTRTRDQSFLIFEQVRAPYSAHNDLWYRTHLGYAHSAWVLPVRVYAPQPFISDIDDWGFWGEISQIHTAARREPYSNASRRYRLYGGTVYHVVDTHKDEKGNGWYKIYDEYPPTNPSHQWVMASDVRRIPRDEMSPIHPFVGEKHIEVDLSEQTLTCYEGEKQAFVTQVASGLGGALATPLGEHHVLLKQPTRHMSNIPYPGGPEPLAPNDIFDLPGVPWNIFFDLSGTAIHGAYWHNDFGIRRSHGCLNVPCEASRWIYRWTYPIGGYQDDFIQSTAQVGTPILIK